MEKLTPAVQALALDHFAKAATGGQVISLPTLDTLLLSALRTPFGDSKLRSDSRVSTSLSQSSILFVRRGVLLSGAIRNIAVFYACSWGLALALVAAVLVRMMMRRTIRVGMREKGGFYQTMRRPVALLSFLLLPSSLPSLLAPLRFVCVSFSLPF